MNFSRILVFGDMEKVRELLRSLKQAGKIFDYAMDIEQVRALIPAFRPELVLVANSISLAERYEIKTIIDRYPGAVMKRASDLRI